MRSETCGVVRDMTSGCRKQLGVTATRGTWWTNRETIIRQEAVASGHSLSPQHVGL